MTNETRIVCSVLSLLFITALESPLLGSKSHAVFNESRYARVATLDGGEIVLLQHSDRRLFEHPLSNRPSYLGFSPYSGDRFVSFVDHQHHGDHSWLKVIRADGSVRFSIRGDFESAYLGPVGSHIVVLGGPGPVSSARVLDLEGREVLRTSPLYVGSQTGFSKDGLAFFTLEEPKNETEKWTISVYELGLREAGRRVIQLPSRSEVSNLSLFRARDGAFLLNGRLTYLPGSSDKAVTGLRIGLKHGEHYLGLGGHGRNGVIVGYREDGFDLVQQGQVIVRVRDGEDDSLPMALAWLDRSRVQPSLNAAGDTLVVEETWAERRKIVIPLSDFLKKLKMDQERPDPRRVKFHVVSRNNIFDHNYEYVAQLDSSRSFEIVRPLGR